MEFKKKTTCINTEHKPKSTLNYSFIQYIFTECFYLSGTILGSRDRAVNNTDKAPYPHAVNFLLREMKNKQDKLIAIYYVS